MENTNKFESWFNKINEDLAQEPTISTDATSVAEPAVAEKPTDRDAMMHDIDTIMTSLETLASELKEELESFDAEELNEAGDSVAKKFMDFTIRAPKARKAQAKVNKYKLKISDLEDMHDSAEKGPKKDKLRAKVDTMKDQATELQNAVDKKIADKGEIVQRAQQSEKIKGQIEVLKNKMGEAGSKDKAQDIKQQAQKLKKRLQDEEAALKSMEPEKKEEPKKEEPKKKEPKNSEESPKEEPKKKEAPKEEPKEEPKKEEPKATTTTSEAPKEEPKKSEETPKEEPKKEDPKVKAAKDKIKEYEDAVDQLKDKKDKSSKDKVGILQAAIAGKKKELEKLTAQESLIVRALDANLNELAEEIASKLEWQLTEGTALHTKYNTVIRKAENDNQLNERLHVSVKDRFRNLL